MKNKSIIMIIAFTVLLLSSCSKKIIELQFENSFWIEYNPKAVSENSNIEIEFTEIIKDDRCPEGVNCLTSGEAVIELLLNKSVHIELSTLPKNSSIDTLEYEIMLMDLEPYPKKDENLNKNNYKSLIQIKQ